MRIAIVDDNSTEQEKLAKLLGDWSTAHHLTPEIILFDSGDAFLNSLSETAYELSSWTSSWTGRTASKRLS